MKNILFLFSIITLLLTGCNKSESDFIDLKFKGRYIEKDHKVDTIEYPVLINQKFWLKRGFEYRNGYYLPKIHTDIYDYEVSGDSINIIPGLSSCRCGYKLFFKMSDNGDSLIIGDFIYHHDSPGLFNLTFIRAPFEALY